MFNRSVVHKRTDRPVGNPFEGPRRGVRWIRRFGAGGTGAGAIAALLIAGCGGGGGSGSAPPQPSGTLTLGGCTIEAGAASCQGAIEWSTANAASPRILFGSATLATTATGSASPPIGAASQTVTLLDGSRVLDSGMLAGTCIAASAWDGSQCQAFAQRSTVRAPTPFVESGLPVTLEVVLYRPPGAGPFPVVMFNHGSTGNGDDPAQFRVTYTSESVAKFFADRGWLVAFAQRRGRGTSDGLYDEGFTPDRSRYSCLSAPALAGFERALLDVDAAAEYLRGRSDVDPARMLSAGTSRGGVLALVHAAQRPDLFEGAVNFVGGWLGEGCQDSIAVNRQLFARGGAFRGPVIGVYGDNDSFYSLAHSRANFDAFVAAGGSGRFLVFTRAPGLNGHFVVNDPDLWSADLDTFLRQL